MSNTEISALQLIANQVNALKSTGPRTEGGKNIAKFNARRHGLTGQFYCMSEGDEIAWNAFQDTILADLKPLGAYETQLAISIAQDQWRLNRSRAVEHNLFAQGHDRHAEHTNTDSPNVQAASTMAETYREDDRAFANIALYETRLHRIIVKNEKRLKELRAERNAAETAAREDAELLVRLALMKGELAATPQPADTESQVNGVAAQSPSYPHVGPLATEIQVNGFVFARAEIIHKINMDEALREARFYKNHGWDGAKTYPTTFPLPKAA